MLQELNAYLQERRVDLRVVRHQKTGNVDNFEKKNIIEYSTARSLGSDKTTMCVYLLIGKFLEKPNELLQERRVDLRVVLRRLHQLR